MDLTANDLLAKAKEELKHVLPGESFIVKDLFQGLEWNRYRRNERLLLGTLFLNYIKTERTDIIPDGKNGANQQKYKMLEKNKEES